MPKVSVVIPTRNRPEAILCCLDALAKQVFPSRDFEVIVVDDGSDPTSMLEVDRWSSRFDLKLIHQKNTGPGGPAIEVSQRRPVSSLPSLMTIAFHRPIGLGTSSQHWRGSRRLWWVVRPSMG